MRSCFSAVGSARAGVDDDGWEKLVKDGKVFGLLTRRFLPLVEEIISQRKRSWNAKNEKTSKKKEIKISFRSGLDESVRQLRPHVNSPLRSMP